MIGKSHRLADGGCIDRGDPIQFKFNGEAYVGYRGDTLASALLANGVGLVSRSFKYHRPRGVYTAGPEEPNAIVTLGTGARSEPNTPATMAELYDGLQATSQNCWPSLRFDIGAVNQLASPLLHAGFYYKTFMWPASLWEPLYEKLIRRAAGLGRAPAEGDPDTYQRRRIHCDVLVVGSGPSGLAAAMAAARTGARVVVAEQHAHFGGSLNWNDDHIDDQAGADWAKQAVEALRDYPEVELLSRTTVFGYYDHNMLAAIERVSDHVSHPDPRLPRQRYLTIRAKHVVLACGAIERPMLFSDNDRPGVMLASAARTYVWQYGVRLARSAVVFTNNDDAYRTAIALRSGGSKVTVVDCRESAGPISAQAKALEIECRNGEMVVSSIGTRKVAAARIASLGNPSSIRRIDCDLIATSGGWTPSVHLHSQSGGRPIYSEKLATFVPGKSVQAERSAGAANGTFSLEGCLREGAAAGEEAARLCNGAKSVHQVRVPVQSSDVEVAQGSLLEVPSSLSSDGKKFIDLQGDVTRADVVLSVKEGYDSPELLKRYTTTGMWTDQGKIGNLNAVSVLADVRRTETAMLGTTHFRPPYTPVAISAFSGTQTGLRYRPLRRTPMYEWHIAHGAEMQIASLWMRPSYYPERHETQQQAIDREVFLVRNNVGLADTSTLGKISVQGPDAAEFLDRVYCNGWSTLRPGRARFGLMLREDGIVFDDGTTACISENRYHMTTSTERAALVLAHLEFCLQCLWPDLQVHLTNTTAQWGVIALSGPNARIALQRAVDDADVSNEALPALGVKDATICGMPVRLFRIAYSGELSYEINVPAHYALSVWEAILTAGAPLGIRPFGAAAMTVMRTEKGHVSGPEIDGRVTARDLGMGRMMKSKKNYSGRRLADRPVLTDPKRPSLVGFIPVDRNAEIRPGSQIVEKPRARPPITPIGYISTAVYSPSLGHWIALGFISGGTARKGETVTASFPLKREVVRVQVVDPIFYDPEGNRLNA